MVSGSLGSGVVLVAYGAVIVAALLARRRAAGIAGRAWLAIAILLFTLALEKTVHAETLLLRQADAVAAAGGWHARRAGFQLRLIAALAAAALASAALITWCLRRVGKATIVAALSALVLAAFVSIRAVSLHRLDRLLATDIGPLRASNVVELSALGIVGVCAWTVAQHDARNGGG